MNTRKSQKDIVIVTGVKFTSALRLFTAGQKVTYVQHGGETYKMNAGAGVLRQLKDSYEIWATGYAEDDVIRADEMGWIEKSRFQIVDLLDVVAVKQFVQKVAARKRETGAQVHLVHYGGASDTPVELPNNSLLAHTWDMKAEALPHLVANNCVTLLHILQEMKRQDIFTDQPISKVLLISAAAALRVKQELGLDSAQKGAGHNLIRNIALDLTPENIFVTEIMPGSTDTGFFDNDYTLQTAVRITKNLGYHPTEETYPVFTAEQIGDAAKYVLDAKCNVREITLLPYGQFPHLGA